MQLGWLFENFMSTEAFADTSTVKVHILEKRSHATLRILKEKS